MGTSVKYLYSFKTIKYSLCDHKIDNLLQVLKYKLLFDKDQLWSVVLLISYKILNGYGYLKKKSVIPKLWLTYVVTHLPFLPIDINECVQYF